jgi:hypothetical protein
VHEARISWLQYPSSNSVSVSVLLQMVPLVLVLCLVLCYVSFRFRRRRMEALAAKISGPPAWPLVGNALQLLGSTHGKGRHSLPPLALCVSAPLLTPRRLPSCPQTCSSPFRGCYSATRLPSHSGWALVSTWPSRVLQTSR